MYARDVTSVSPVALALFGGRLKIYEKHGVATLEGEGRQRGRERERERGGETERDREGETDRERERQRGGDRERERGRDSDR